MSERFNIAVCFLSLGLVMLHSLPTKASAQRFRVAGLYARSSKTHPSYTYSVEAACITEAAITRARTKGLEVSFAFVDQGWDFAGTVEAAKKIVSDKYDAVVGGLVSLDALVAADIFEANGVPFITPTASHPEVTAGRKYVTRISFNDYRQASLLAKLTFTELKPLRIAVIRNASQPYSDFLGKQYASELRTLGYGDRLNEFTIIDGFKDFGTLVPAILRTKPDLIFVSLTQPNTASVYVELAKHHGRLTLLSSDTIEGKPAFLKSLGPKNSHVRFIYPKHWNDRFEGPEADSYRSLHRQFCRKYVPSMTTVAAYDAAELLIRTLRSDPSLRGKALVQAMRSTVYIGMTGPINYGSDGDPIKGLELFELKGERAVYWKRYE